MMYMKSFLGSFFIESGSVVYFLKGREVLREEVLREEGLEEGGNMVSGECWGVFKIG
jgi:hypothetical protein